MRSHTMDSGKSPLPDTPPLYSVTSIMKRSIHLSYLSSHLCLQLQHRADWCGSLYDCHCIPFFFGTETDHSGIMFPVSRIKKNCKIDMLCSWCILLKHLQVFPENGLEVKVSGSGATGSYPTTLSPSMLMIDWRCMDVFLLWLSQ